MDTHRHQQRRRRTALAAATAALLVPVTAACGSEQAGAGGNAARTTGADSATAGTTQRSLTGIRWNVDSVTADGTTHRATSDAYMILTEDGGVEGSYGCNSFRGQTVPEGDRVRLEDLRSTAVACDGPGREFDHALLDAFTGDGPRAEMKDGRLTLTSEDGTTVRFSEGGGDTPLHGTRWRITSPDAAGRAHLTFDKEEGTVSGSLGCNKVNAGATVRDGHITVGTPTTTRMVCEDSLMKAEKQLLRFFGTTLDYRVDHRSMTLTSENGGTVNAFAAP
ncbi:META domain-containing protein [Streptomyces prasinopilosus]|uniref:META domain-containing protein n=1 Tax=Streptomyces prasinopilosus TaxID=67344 RepID=UPI0006EBB9FB|nr:META domain-containing protein [Streptomyces prasinopilosus]